MTVVDIEESKKNINHSFKIKPMSILAENVKDKQNSMEEIIYHG